MKTVHVSRSNDALPDAGGGSCCIGAAVYGPGRCTCWRPVHDVTQEQGEQGPLAVRSEMCVDCAFRKNSPERRGDERYAHAGTVDEMATDDDGQFVCHQGMRRKVALVHPSGARVEIETDAYDPTEPRPLCMQG